MEKLGEREAMGCTPTRLHRATFQGDVGGKFDVQEADNSSEKDDRRDAVLKGIILLVGWQMICKPRTQYRWIEPRGCVFVPV